MTPKRSGPDSGSRAASAASLTASSAVSAVAGALHQFQAGRGEHHVATGGAVQDGRVELPLQRQQPGGQGGLRDRADDGRPAEMSGLGQRDALAELLGARENGHRKFLDLFRRVLTLR